MYRHRWPVLGQHPLAERFTLHKGDRLKATHQPFSSKAESTDASEGVQQAQHPANAMQNKLGKLSGFT